MVRAFVILFLCVACLGASSWNIRYHLSTKTMYSPSYDFSTPPDTCSPVQVNLVARHGARYPTSGDIKKFSDLQVVMNQHAGEYLPAYEWMGTWKNPYTTLEAGEITYSGQVEHYNLAQRMLNLYRGPMGEPYQPYTYALQSTQVSRTGRSGTSFGYSLFQNQTSGGILPYPGGSFNPFFIYSNSADQDVQLRFFDVCPVYTQTVDDNSTAVDQATIYFTNQVAAAGLQLSKMIGVYPEWNISASEISMMYKGCGFDIAVYNKTNEFCALFDDETIGNVLEYYNDLSNYYTKGYGYSINYEIACILLQDIIDIQTNFVNNTNTNLKGKYRFAHAETIMPLVSLLGLYKDASPLMADWTEEQQENREWRTSIISPFAANVQFILYQCSDDFKVKVLVNEVEQLLPGCSSVYCDFNDILSHYSSQLTCNYQDLCFYGESLCDYYCQS